MPCNRTALWLALGLSTALPAWAGGVAEVESGAGGESVRARLEFDGDRLRMEAGTDGYLLFRDGVPYAVSTVDGETMVMDVTALLRMGAGLASQQPGGLDLDAVAEYRGLHGSGRAETVAGVRGELYRLDYLDRAGRSQSRELVLSGQPTVREMSQALIRYGEVMQQASGQPEPAGSRQLQLELDRRQLGLLRYGEEFRLVSVQHARPAASRFELPASPSQLPLALPAVMAGGEGAGAGSAGGLGAIFGGKLERQKERVQGRTDAEADAATDRAVDKVLDKAFGKLFGGD